MTVKELSTDNSIYFINKEIKDNSEKPKELKIEKKVEYPNETNENNDKKASSEKFIHIYKNGEVIKIGLFDTKMSLDSLRNLLKNDISNKGKFLSEGMGVPIGDEKNIKLFRVIKENIIYIEDTMSSEIKEVPKKEEEKIPIILKFDENSSSIIKANSNDKLDKIREQNSYLIKNEFLFTLHGSVITKDQESTFSIGEIMDSANTIILKNNKQKMKIKILEDKKSIKSEQNIDPAYKISDLRRDLSLENNKVFQKGSNEIDIGD